MFERNLSSELNEVLNKDDQTAVLAHIVNKQFLELVKLPIPLQRKQLLAYYDAHSSNYEILANAVQTDNNKHPVLFCLYALVVPDINALDLVKLNYSKEHLEELAQLSPVYQPLLGNLRAIALVLDYETFEPLALPGHSYLNLAGAKLEDANLAGQNLSYANLTNAKLDRADLRTCNLSHALLNDVSAEAANFTGGTFHHTSFHGGYFADAIFRKASFRFSDLNGCFTNATLEDADLRRARLCSRTLDLRGANLSDAKFNSSTQFLYVRGNASQAAYKQYLAERKAMFSQVQFISEKQITSKDALDAALFQLYVQLEPNEHFAFLQECIGHDFIVKAQKLIADNRPLVSSLRETAYTNSLFESAYAPLSAVNSLSRSMHSLFGDATEQRELSSVFETKAQEQIRSLLR